MFKGLLGAFQVIKGVSMGPQRRFRASQMVPVGFMGSWGCFSGSQVMSWELLEDSRGLRGRAAEVSGTPKKVAEAFNGVSGAF